jgi:hypothetical protein
MSARISAPTHPRLHARRSFIQRPEYLTLNSRFVFREGRTKGIGIIIGTDHEQLPPHPAPASATSSGEGTAATAATIGGGGGGGGASDESGAKKGSSDGGGAPAAAGAQRPSGGVGAAARGVAVGAH